MVEKVGCCICGINEHEDIKWVYGHTHRGNRRRHWIKFLHSRECQLMLGLLLLLDVFILFTQIFLDAHFPPCFAVEDAAECRILDGDNSSTTLLTHVELHCLTDDRELLVDIKEYLFYASISILAIFEIELSMLVVVLGVIGFFRNFGYIFDTFIISTSLALEVLLHNTESGAAVGLLIGARVWRLVRIGHGILYSSATRRKAVGEFLSVADSELSLNNKLKVDFENLGVNEEDEEIVIEEELKREEHEEELVRKEKLAKTMSRAGGPVTSPAPVTNPAPIPKAASPPQPKELSGAPQGKPSL